MTKTEALAALVDAQEELRALAPYAKTEKEENRLRKIAADLELLSGYIYWYTPKLGDREGWSVDFGGMGETLT